MSQAPKSQRIRDPLHNLIEFNGSDQFEHALWQVIQTRPFQRLRRIKQLGFSELVYPGATHTRFAHSVGVFHIARQLMGIIRRHLTTNGQQVWDHQMRLALAGALVHDLGHGMFSHAFEDVGRQLDLKLAHHEHVSDLLIRSDEIAEALRPLGKSFSDEVATLIKRKGPATLYDAVVSSQFDADRLDYMQRDRLMTGVQNGGIDFTWLMANLKVGALKRGVDETQLRDIDTFVLGPKAIQAAETFVLTLFQLYPNIYYHKTTRGAEKVFTALILRLIELVRAGHAEKAGLPASHPIIRFALEPEKVENVLRLDDAVFWGALSMLCDAADVGIQTLALSLRDRKLPKCFDAREYILSQAPERHADKKTFEERMTRAEGRMLELVADWNKKYSKSTPRIFIDRADRDPYNRLEESKGPLNQIRIMTTSGEIMDAADCSPVVAALEKYKLCRLYTTAGDSEAREAAKSIVQRGWEEGKHAT
jgi:HD superfamily phosphohydrolase